jgi:hypothetical protein
MPIIKFMRKNNNNAEEGGGGHECRTVVNATFHAHRSKNNKNNNKRGGLDLRSNRVELVHGLVQVFH